MQNINRLAAGENVYLYMLNEKNHPLLKIFDKYIVALLQI